MKEKCKLCIGIGIFECEHSPQPEKCEGVCKSNEEGEEWMSCSCPQPEECDVFKGWYNTMTGDKIDILINKQTGEGIFEHTTLKELVKTEIRKAEEKKDNYYKTEIVKIIKEWENRSNSERYIGARELIESLEALKK